MIGLMVALLTIFLCMVSMLFVLRRLGVTLGNGYGIMTKLYCVASRKQSFTRVLPQEFDISYREF